MAKGKRRRSDRRLLVGVFRWPAGVTRKHNALWRFFITTKLDTSVVQLGGRVVPLAVGLVLEPAAVALYHVAPRLGMLLAAPTMVLARTVYPELANLAATADFRVILRVTVRTGAIAGIGVLPLFLVYLVLVTRSSKASGRGVRWGL